MSENRCPHCGEEIPSGPAYCRACGRRTKDYRLCPGCNEPVAERALFCPYCTQRIPTERDQAAQELHIEFRATHLGAFFSTGSLTALFLPPFIDVSGGRVHVRKWTLLGLRRHHQEIQVSRVASVRYTKGVFWGGLLVETFGGSTEDISERGLRQEDARQMAEQLKSVLTE